MRINFIFCFLMLFSFTTVAQDYSTKGEIYDFDIGDEFHFRKEYSGGGYMEEYSNVLIIDKYVSPGLDTITYSKFIIKSTWYGNDTIWHYTQDTISITYTNLEALFFADSVYFSSYYNRKISWQDRTIPPYWIEHKYYADGCGIIRHDQREVQLPAYDLDYWLIYYKKGNEEWGTPYIIVNIRENIEPDNIIDIYPNPARDILHISTTESMEEVRIYDQSGRHVLTPTANETAIDVSSLNRGIFFLTIITGKGRSCKKFVKQ